MNIAQVLIKTIAVPGVSGCNWFGPTAKAYSLSVAALPGGVPMPFLTAYPTGAGRPGTSFLNAFEGQMMTNSVLVPAGSDGAIQLYAYRRTLVIVEMAGFFAR